MKYIFGTKEGMTQIFDETGTAFAATVLRVEPLRVTQIKTAEKDGYAAVQLAGGTRKEKHVAKAQKASGVGTARYVREFRPRADRGETIDGVAADATADVSSFAVGDVVAVSAVSKSKGFQGVVKRHGFGGDKASHGRKHSKRAPGSIGGGGRAGGRVIKGMRMAGRMGGERVTVKNLRVLQTNAEANLLLVSGAVPGRKGTLVEIRGV
jgi:large subunit ribosomal protein L3